jgi:anti-anti-sigma regulatory factor
MVAVTTPGQMVISGHAPGILVPPASRQSAYRSQIRRLKVDRYLVSSRGKLIASTLIEFNTGNGNGRETMFRIGIHDHSESVSLTIEGKLTRPSAIELEKCWQTVIAAEPLKSIVVNLVAVTFVDSECRGLLIRMRRQGVKLVPTGCLMKAIVEQIDAEVAQETLCSGISI